jgi:hypothetical protein
LHHGCLLDRVPSIEPKGEDEDEKVDEVQEDVERKKNTAGIVGGHHILQCTKTLLKEKEKGEINSCHF